MAELSLIRWKSLRDLELKEPDYILNRLARGEVGMIQAVTNAGKTTLALNASICMAVGRPMEPLVKKGPPRKILYLDYETPIEVMKEDLLNMEDVLTDEERELLGENLTIYNFTNPFARELNLGSDSDRRHVTSLARELEIDLIIIDPITLAFIGINEQDNTVVAEKIFGPLRKMARESGGAAILFAHHVGKMRLEEGQTMQPALKSRGASAFGSLSRFTLDIDSRQGDLPHSVLSFAKVKGRIPPACEMIYNEDMRWFSLNPLEKVEADTSVDRIIKALMELGGEATRAQIMEKSGLGRGSLDRWLKQGVERNVFGKDSRGSYHLRTRPEKSDLELSMTART